NDVDPGQGILENDVRASISIHIVDADHVHRGGRNGTDLFLATRDPSRAEGQNLEMPVRLSDEEVMILGVWEVSHPNDRLACLESRAEGHVRVVEEVERIDRADDDH